MVPRQHLTLSVGSGVILGLLLRSWAAGALCCFTGIFVDLDHLFDFWLNRGFSLNIRKFLDYCVNGTAPKFYDLLHGFEYIPICLWFTSIPRVRSLAWGITVGYTLHLLGDQLFNTHLSRWTYFFSYRLFHRFASDKIVLFKPAIGKM